MKVFSRRVLLCKVLLVVVSLLVAALPRAASADPSTGDSTNGATGDFGEALSVPQIGTTGAMTYEIPITLPTPRGKERLHLAVAYNSSQQDGDVGYGWSLSLPTITRKRLSGWPLYINPPADNADRFEFNGRPLVYVCTLGLNTCPAEPYPSLLTSVGASYYRLQDDDTHARFFYNGATVWQMQTKGGIMMEFGDSYYFTAPSSPPAVDAEAGYNGNPYRWHLVSVVDMDHNYVTIRWAPMGRLGRVYPTDIYDTTSVDYSGSTSQFEHHAQLIWESNPFWISTHAHVDHAPNEYRLARVGVASKTWADANTNREVVRQVRFSYLSPRTTADYVPGSAPLWHHSFLSQVVEEGDCQALEDGSENVPDGTNCPTRTLAALHYETAQIASPSGTLNSNTMTGRATFNFSLPYNGTGLIGVHVPHEVDPHDSGHFEPAVYGTNAIVLDLNRDGRPDVVPTFTPDVAVHFPINAGPQLGDPADRDQTNGEAWVNKGGLPGGFVNYQHSCADLTLINNLFSDGVFRFLSPSGATSLTVNAGGALARWGFAPFGAPSVDTFVSLMPDSADSSGYCPERAQDPTHPSFKWKAPSGTMMSGWARQNTDVSGMNAMDWYGDIDGDGRLDALLRYDNGQPVDSRWSSAFINYGRRFPVDGATNAYAHYEALWIDPDGVWSSAAQAQQDFATGTTSQHLAPAPSPDPAEHYAYVDMTGDGLVDLVHYRLGDPTVAVRAGDGRGSFGCDGVNDPPAHCSTQVGDPTWVSAAYGMSFAGPVEEPLSLQNTAFWFHDVTGDGLADLVAYDRGAVDGWVRLWVNIDGKTLACATPNAPTPCTIARPTRSDGGGANMPNSQVAFADVDSNGVDDMMLIDFSGVYSVSFLSGTAISGSIPARAPSPGLLTQIDNGHGGSMQIRYMTIQEHELYTENVTQGNVHWASHVPFVVPIVQQTKLTNTAAMGAPFNYDRTVSFTYVDPVYDAWEQRFSGFKQVVAQKDGGDSTDTRYWFSGCHLSGDQDPVDPTSSCQASSDDDPVGIFSGRAVRVDHYVGPLFAPQKWISSSITRFSDGLDAPLSFQGLPPNGAERRHVRYVPTVTSDEYIYDANLPVGAAVDHIPVPQYSPLCQRDVRHLPPRII